MQTITVCITTMMGHGGLVNGIRECLAVAGITTIQTQSDNTRIIMRFLYISMAILIIFIGIGIQRDLNSGTFMNRNVITIFELSLLPMSAYDSDESIMLRKFGIVLPGGKWHEVESKYFFWGKPSVAAYVAPYSNILRKAVSVYRSNVKLEDEVRLDIINLLTSQDDGRRGTIIEKYK